ncbi:MAG TPA: ABC transporter permease [Anaerolineae bacterium]
MVTSKLLAFFQHGFVLARSYKLNFAAKYFTTLVTVVFYLFLAELFRRMNVALPPGTDPLITDPLVTGPLTTDYFTFLLVGGAFSKYVEINMRTLPDTLREEMLVGTLEPLLSTATPTTLALLGPSLFILVEGTLLVTVQLVIGAFFGADFSRANWPAAVCLTGLMVGCLFCWGVISAAFTLRYKRQDPVNNIVGAITYVFSGVFFPVSMLPPAMQVISYLLPFTYGLQGLRGALLNGRGLIELGPDVAALLIFTAVLLPIALFSIRGATRYLKHSGALGHY